MAEWDLLNWQAMIIELIIAGIIAIVLSVIFYKRQEKERKRVDRIILEQENFGKKRARFAIWYIKLELQIVKAFINLTDTFHVEGEKAHNHMVWLMSNAENSLKKITTLLEIYGDVLDPITVRDLVAVSENIKGYFKKFNPKIRNEKEIFQINKRLDEILSVLPDYGEEFNDSIK